MSDIMKKLHQDHKNIARLLDLLEEQLELLRSDDEPDWPLVADMLDYVAQYPDSYHHPLEDVLFRHFLQICSDEAPRKAIGKILAEHAEIGTRTSELSRTVSELLGENPFIRRDELGHTLESYISAQRAHLQREETDIFPMIEASMSEDDWRVLDVSTLMEEDPLFDKPEKKHFSRLFQSIVVSA